MKNYIGFANDHSGSMSGLRHAALNDYNANITAVKDAATREMMDTIVSVVGFGMGGSCDVTRTIVNSNPHVLHPMAKWDASGSTPLYDAVGELINLFKSMPDYKDPNVSFLLMVTTDGYENGSRKYDRRSLAQLIQELHRDGRWTLVFRVPRGGRQTLDGLNIPRDNIQEWDTTAAGLAVATAATTAAVSEYYQTRSTGAKSSGTFFASASGVKAADVKANLVNISSEVSLWDVQPNEDKAEIKPFAEKRLGGAPFLKGAAFYQLNKVEPRVQDTKRIIIREKKSGNVYEGAAARQMIGLPASGTVRVHPGQYSEFEIFIQSTSINRHLVAGTKVLYWPKVGEGFTAADFPWLQTGQANIDPTLMAKAAQAIQASAPAPVAKPAPKKAPAGIKVFFDSRDAARRSGKTVHDAGANAPKGKRWYVLK